MINEFEQINSINIFGHLAYGLILMSFLVRRMLLLRSFAIVASCSSIFYNYNVAQNPIWIPIQWNVLFITVNCYHIIMALLARREIKINDVEEFVYGKNFQSMTRVEFKRLLNCGYTRTYHPGQKLVEQHDNLGAIFLILEGEVQVSMNGSVVANLGKGDFVGEMSFLTNQPTKADVLLSEVSRIHYWDMEELKSFFSKNPSILAKFHSAIGNQLITRLVSKSLSEVKLKRAA
ncbi:MAG TPA: cyclic nucleotide-binding domain-containing protein [Bacteriovoracaceae bacterium]|nr:cyclic nucleotide-binding domain-containing protein [Bacteriovoracaceae bacterium]